MTILTSSRLAFSSGLSGITASQHFLSLAPQDIAKNVLKRLSKLSSVTAIIHLQAVPLMPNPIYTYSGKLRLRVSTGKIRLRLKSTRSRARVLLATSRKRIFSGSLRNKTLVGKLRIRKVK